MEVKKNRLVEESEAFAMRIVKLYKHLQGKKELVMSKQVLRSGTSIGANIAEAQYAQSREDFISKMSIALMECSETLYWLRLLNRSDIIESNASYNSLYDNAETLLSLLASTVKTAKQKKGY